MIKRQCIEAFDKSLREIMHLDSTFGGKCFVMGGDFQRILSIISESKVEELSHKRIIVNEMS